MRHQRQTGPLRGRLPVTARARERFFRHGESPAGGEVREEILASWRRSRLLGIDQDAPVIPTESDLDPDTRLIRASRPALEWLYGHFRGAPVTVVLADSRARIVYRVGAPGALELMDAAGLVLGASSDEQFMGTSSVSMVLSTQEPFTVVGEEHFVHGLQVLTCMASPVRNPIGGGLEGAVNLSVPSRLADHRMALALHEATGRIERRLLELSTQRERALVEDFLRSRTRSGHTVLDLGTGRLLPGAAGERPVSAAEHSLLLEKAAELLSAGRTALLDVPLPGGRTAVLRRRPLRHGEVEGATVEVGFRDRGGPRSVPLASPPGGGPQVPLLTPAGVPAAAVGAGPEEEAAAGTDARTGAPAAESGADRADRAENGADRWLLMVGESRAGRLALEARRRLSLLNEAGLRIGTTLDVRRTAEELTEVAVPRFADVAVVDLMQGVEQGEEPPPGGTAVRGAVRRSAAGAEGAPEAAAACGVGQVFRLPSGSPQARCLAAGQPVPDSALHIPGTTPNPLGRPVALLGEGLHSCLAVPLRARGTVLGVAVFYRRGKDRPFEEDDLALGGELGARAAVAVDSARRFTHERETALALQRSLLPTCLPRLSGVEVASRYLPARGACGVGGDWFDVIPLPGTRVALVVGDVAGHGVHATATMGRLRTAVHTLADLDLPPEEVLAHLDSLVSRRPAGDDGEDAAVGATCLYLVHDPVSRRCTAARAGHPPPAVIPPGGGRPYLLDVPAGPPLGLGGLMPYEAFEAELPGGSLLALYTNGLTRARDRYAVDREERLLDALGRPAPSLDALCDSTIGELLPEEAREEQRDDIALLVARPRALADEKVAAWELPSDPAVVRTSRALVARQLRDWDLPYLEDSTELVVSELVTNAVRYGGDGPVRLRLLRDTTLICEVSDTSSSSPRIRRAGTTEEGGRGLFLVARFSQDWGARYTPGGKTVWAEQSLSASRGPGTLDEDSLLDLFDTDAPAA
ncbi:SpoIIE family protein phosphatase [Streptomyces thermolineatus]|uniref:SpoIIE family protein phosphatase n=1 Tax=Streptomyces thermolineatus TaxID=44033 RepID=UPI00384F7102